MKNEEEKSQNKEESKLDIYSPFENDLEFLLKIKSEVIKRKENQENLKHWKNNVEDYEKKIDFKSVKTKFREFLKEIINIGLYKDQLSDIRMRDERKPIYQETFKPLSQKMQGYLKKNLIPSLYSHQAAAIDLVREGKDVVISTSTASGKTLAFNIPVIENIMEDPNSRALYLYPTKALTKDQHKNLKKLEIYLDLNIKPEIYDGSTPKEIKRFIRKTSKIIMSNPYGFHEYLQQHYLWKDFFKNLKYIILDEAHYYNGVFGSNVAYLLRRILRICEYYGSEPNFILSSATLSNPEQHAKALTNREFRLVEKDGSRQGKRFFVLWNPPLKDHLENTRYSSFRETIYILSKLLMKGIQTLCFAPTHQIAEKIAKLTKDKLENVNPELAKKIKAYRGGYLDRKRTQIENEFKNGDLLGVVSTPALELGIDIGSLECVLISGYPGRFISTWQQAGRAGRGEKESLVIMIANQHPLDQYFMKHPDSFFKNIREASIVDLDNRYVIKGQILCAIAESQEGIKFSEKDKKYFPYHFEESIAELENELKIKRNEDGWEYSYEELPKNSEIHPLSYSSENYRIFYNGYLLEEVSREKVYRNVFPGAVYFHSGESYIVKSLNLEQGYADVIKKDVDYYTEAIDEPAVTILKEIDEKIIGKKPGIVFGFGDVQIHAQYKEFMIKINNNIIERKKLDLPPFSYNTKGMWIKLPKTLETIIQEKELNFRDGLLAILCSMSSLAPIYSSGDIWDHGGVVYQFYPETESPMVFLYDSQEFGNGISHILYNHSESLIKTTLEHIKRCKCLKGCPSCILIHKCGRRKVELNKKDAIGILEVIVSLMEEEETDSYQVDPYKSNKHKENPILGWYEKGKIIENINERNAYYRSGLTRSEDYKAYVYLGLGDVLYEMLKFEEAESLYKKGFEYLGNDSIITSYMYKALGDIQMIKRNFKKALKNYKKSLLKNIEFAQAWNALGILHENLDNTTEAIENYREAIKYGSEEAQVNLEKAEKIFHESYKKKIDFEIKNQEKFIKPKEAYLRKFGLKPPFSAYKGSSPYIFVSYCHEDKELVYPIIKNIQEDGFNIWYDEGIEYSENWLKKIANSLLNCSTFITFISKNIYESKYTQREINFILNEPRTENVPVIAIYLEEIDLPEELKLNMIGSQAIMNFKIESEHIYFKLISQLRKLLQS